MHWTYATHSSQTILCVCVTHRKKKKRDYTPRFIFYQAQLNAYAWQYIYTAVAESTQCNAGHKAWYSYRVWVHFSPCHYPPWGHCIEMSKTLISGNVPSGMDSHICKHSIVRRHTRQTTACSYWWLEMSHWPNTETGQNKQFTVTGSSVCFVCKFLFTKLEINLFDKILLNWPFYKAKNINAVYYSQSNTRSFATFLQMV